MSIERDLVFIVSGGRTGTRFMGDLLSSMIPGAYSVHEPDVLEGLTLRTWRRIQEFGFYHMVLGRILKHTGIRHLSEGFLSGDLTVEEVQRAIKKQRFGYYQKINQPIVVESYYQWYGILPVIPKTFSSYRILGVLRDPRDWVRSWLNFEAHHGRRDLVKKIGRERINPKMTGEQPYASEWGSMDPLSRLCWTWKTVYTCVLDHAEIDPQMHLVKYENLFKDSERQHAWKEILDFITGFDKKSYTYEFDPEFLNYRIHASNQSKVPAWSEWSAGNRERLLSICGEVMIRAGYSPDG